MSDARDPQIATDAHGYARAVWRQKGGKVWWHDYYSMWSNEFNPESGWGVRELVVDAESEHAPGFYGHVYSPQVAMYDGQTAAVVVVDNPDDPAYPPVFDPYVVGMYHRRDVGDWLQGALLSGAGSVEPQVAMAGFYAMAVWQSKTFDIYACRSKSGGPFATHPSDAELIENLQFPAVHPHVAAIETWAEVPVQVIAVWEQYDGVGQFDIWANLYKHRDNGWGQATIIESNHQGSGQFPRVAMDASGNAVVVWMQYDGAAHFDIWANRYTPSGGWGMAEMIEANNPESATDPRVAVDASGSAIAVWSQGGLAFDSVHSIWANRYTPSGGWGVAQLIENDDLGTANKPQIAMNPDGHAVVVWAQHDGIGTFDIRSNRYTPSVGWGTVESVESYPGDALDPQVSMDLSGSATAVWMQFSGSIYDIWSNRLQ